MSGRALLIMAALGLAGCGADGSGKAAALASVAPAVMVDAIAACTANPPVGKAIDEAGLIAAGWKPTERTIDRDGQRTTPPPTEARPLQDDEFEGSTWVKADVPAVIHVSRNPISMGECSIEVEPIGGAAAMDRAMQVKFGRTADRVGTRPLGGDQLTPRNDKPVPSRMWMAPQHDVYLLEFDGGSVRAEVVAMPDRATLDRYDPANPKTRIFVEGEQ